MADETINGTRYWDYARVGSGQQTVNTGGGRDYIISYGDGGEPNPAQTGGDGTGRVNAPIAEGSADDILTGGDRGDTFEFRALLNAKEEVIAQHTNSAGRVNWRGVAGENDNVHDHWVEGWGNDTITDYSKAEGDKIVVRGHTVELAGIEYDTDEGGAYSLITIRSQQGNGGAGGANTATGAHDEDVLGTIKVYGDKVTANDVAIKAANIFDGIDQLHHVDETFGNAEAGVTQVVYSNTDGTDYDGIMGKQTDIVHVGLGNQSVDAGGGHDRIYSYSDNGEPNPAQTGGEGVGRVNQPVAEGEADDLLAGGQGRDLFQFNFLLNAKEEILEKHTRSDGSINWRGVAGENDNVHDHWVEGIGNDTILDFSKQDRDKIVLRGHTVEIAGIEQGEDDGGQFSLISVRSQQGDGGGAHDEDSLGTVKVYGDVVTKDDIVVKAAGVFDGIDKLDGITEGEARSPANNAAPATAAAEALAEPEPVEHTFEGTSHSDRIYAGSGKQTVDGGARNDHIISYGDDGEPNPAQTGGTGEGRVNPAVPDGHADDVLTGGAGRDTFEFRALLNAKESVQEAHTNSAGYVNWRGVAGENDNVHDHWVEGFGNDTITDYSKKEGDKILVRGHTVELAGIEYGEDEDGEAYSLISIRSQQGNGGAGGANTATGAHDEDSLGTIRVYGDKVEKGDVIIKAANIFDGVDQLAQADKLADYNGGVQEFTSETDGEAIVTAKDDVKTTDYVRIGAGSQTVDTGAGNDRIRLTSDAGEPDPAQTNGSEGRINAPVDPSLANDRVAGGQGRDTFLFNIQLNATAAVLARHTRDDGSVNWRRVAGENDAVHDHWVEGIGNDVVLDFSKQDRDRIEIRGHTVEVASITYDVDDKGEDYSLITLRSQQGAGGGAHDEDPLGTIMVYGDKVTAGDLRVNARVFDGIDAYADASASSAVGGLLTGTRGEDDLVGTDGVDIIHGRHGRDVVNGVDGDDFLFGDGHHDMVFGGDGNDWVEGGSGNDELHGNDGNDTIVADSGFDTMFGGEGEDVFVFENGSRGGRINDFEDGVDLIDFSRIDNVSGMDKLDIEAISANRHVVSYINDDGRSVSVQITGQADTTLDSGDFLF